MKCDVCCGDNITVRVRDFGDGEEHRLCDSCAAAYDCRWFDRFCVACRHPRQFEDAIPGVFVEPKCRRRDGCGYEKIDADHPAWDDANDEFGN